MTFKVVVRRNELPPINNATGGYRVRFRIVSADRNRTSAWVATSLTPLTARTRNLGLGMVAKVDKTTNPSSITATWDYDPDTKDEYDVYVAYDTDQWEFKGRTAMLTYTWLAPTGKSTAKIEIKSPSYPVGEWSELPPPLYTTSVSLV